jgi:hypothetical protein
VEAKGAGRPVEWEGNAHQQSQAHCHCPMREYRSHHPTRPRPAEARGGGRVLLAVAGVRGDPPEALLQKMSGCSPDKERPVGGGHPVHSSCRAAASFRVGTVGVSAAAPPPGGELESVESVVVVGAGKPSQVQPPVIWGWLVATRRGPGPVGGGLARRLSALEAAGRSDLV